MTTSLRANFSYMVAPGLFSVIQDELKIVDVVYPQLLNVESSDRKYEEIAEIEGFGAAPVKLEGNDVTFANLTQGYKTTFTSNTYGYGLRFSRELYDDDLYSATGKQAAKYLASSIKQTRDTNAANILNNGYTDSSAYHGADSKPLFSTSHPFKAGGTWSNYIATAADLDVSSLQDLMILLRKTANSGGAPLGLRGKYLIVPPDLEYTARVILESAGEAETAYNNKNVLKGQLELIVWDYLTDTDAFFVATEKSRHHLYFWERMAPKGEADDDFKSGDAMFKITDRHVVGWASGRGIVGSPGV